VNSIKENFEGSFQLLPGIPIPLIGWLHTWGATTNNAYGGNKAGWCV